MVCFVGAGPGAPDLITLRGARLIGEADAVVYAGSLVNPALLDGVRPGCELHDSAGMTLEQVVSVLLRVHRAGGMAVRLHTGDPSLYGAVREQMDRLEREGVPFEVVPGVSSFLAAAAALRAEYTLPGVSQTVILTRCEGRTAVPERERIAALAAHRATMAVFLSVGLLEELRRGLLEGGYRPDCPAAVVYRASWPDERVLRTTVERLPEDAARAGIARQALVLAGDFLGNDYELSRLYDKHFSHGYRKGEAQ